jgi:AraC-like DNA-binding protein
MVRFDPTRPDFSPYGFSCVRWTPTRMSRCDRHNEIELNLLEKGALMYLIGGRRATVPAGRLTAFWAGIPHQILDFETNDSYFVMTIPLTWFLQWRLPEPLARSILHGEFWVEPDQRFKTADLEKFETWLEDLGSGDEDRCKTSLLEIEARMRRLAMRLSVAEPSSIHRKTPGTLNPRLLSRAEEMAYYISRHYTKQLTAEEVAKHVGLHANYAMTLFKQTFGTTLLQHITQHRLSHAQRLLVTTTDSVLKISHHSGFGSLSRFNEAFRRAFGCTPRDYRIAHRM